MSPNYIDITTLSNILKKFNQKDKCSPCPPGAKCDGKIRSIDDYHGFKSSSTTLKFMPCPSGYCCTSKSTTCESYNSCEKGRVGLLCGSCAPGYKQSFMSDKCIPKGDSSCNPFIFAVYYLLVAFSQTTIFTFLPLLTELLKEMIAKVKSKKFVNSTKSVDCEQHTDIVVDLIKSDSNEIFEEDIGPSYGKDEDVTIRILQVNNDDTDDLPLSAFVTMMFLYFQLAFLVHIDNLQQSTTNEDGGNNNDMKTVLSSLVNLRMSVSRKICPTDDLNLLVKELLMIALKLCSFFNLLLFYFVYLFVKTLTKNMNNNTKIDEQEVQFEDCYLPHTSNELQKNNTSDRGWRTKQLYFTGLLQMGFIKLLKLNYTSLCTTLLQLVHCVEIGGKSHLYIYSDQLCTTRWQQVITYVLVPILVMFPWSFGKALDLLKKQSITTSTFLYASLIPFLVVWLHLKRWLIRMQKPNLSTDEKLCIENILDGEETLFRANPGQFRWPVLQLYRSLLIAVLSIFMLNPFYRSMAFLLLFLSFAVHDLHRMPYKHPYLNIVQVMSSCCLLLITACNIPSSISFMGDIMVVPHMDIVVQILRTFELILYAVLPLSFIVWKVWEKYLKDHV